VEALVNRVVAAVGGALKSAAVATGHDYLKDVGDGTGSSTVMAPLMWIARTFPEAPVAIWQRNEDEEEERVYDHPMLRLIRRPNRFYSGSVLWMATLVDWFIDGNAYWIFVRDRGGEIREVWWAPHWLMEPKGTETVFITHYEYNPTGVPINIPVDDVLHFRFGLDGDDPRKGRAPLKSVLREVFTDDEAANFTASLLRNMGVPGLLVSPDGERPPTDEVVKATKAYLRQQFTGDNRGEPLVMSGPTKVHQFGFSPEQLLLKEIRRIPEERVTAVIGVPAIVAGLGAGLDRSTFSNFSEAREAAYEQTIIPTQVTMGEELWFQFLTHFESDEALWRMRVGFDLQNVRVLQPDQDKLFQRLDVGVRGSWVKRGEARRKAGFPVAEDGSDDVYLVQMATAVVPADGGEAQTFAPGGDRRRALAAITEATHNGNGDYS
jgi:HK97 family phage portal protein